MDFVDAPDEAAFRKEVRTFIETEAPKPAKGMSGEEALVANWDAEPGLVQEAGRARAGSRQPGRRSTAAPV